MAEENWIEWQGGEMPVAPDTEIEVVFGYGQAWDGKASAFDWALGGSDGISMYRVIDPASPEAFFRN